MASSQTSTSRVTKKQKFTINPPRQLFIDLTKDDIKTPSPKQKPQSPHAPNVPIKTPSTRGTSSSSSIASKLNSSPFYSSFPTTNPYLSYNNSPPLRVPHPSPLHEHQPMDITFTVSPITPLDYAFNTPSPPLPSPSIVAYPIPFNLLDPMKQLVYVKNKNVKPLKTTVLHFPELCAQLFDGTITTGIKGGGLSSHEPVYVGEPHMVEDADATKRRQPTDGVEEEILGVLKVIAGKIVESEPPRKLEPPTLKDCQGNLIDLKWVEDDPLYEVALAIFCEPTDRYREGWMKLKPKRYVGWVKMIGRSKGFMYQYRHFTSNLSAFWLTCGD
ncbi:hypothetical protein Tco_1507921 [Tanacetum coccineum]